MKLLSFQLILWFCVLKNSAQQEVVIISNTTSLYVGDTILLTCVGFGQLQPDVEITWSKNGADIMNSSSTIIYEEEIAEGGRTFKVSTLVLCGLQGSGAGSYNCTVRNNQTTMTATTQLSVPVVMFDLSTYSMFEGSDANVGVVLSEPVNREITVDVVTVPGTADDTDYQALNTTITFSPGQVSTSVTVNSTHDNIREGGFEDFSVILQNPAGGAGLGTTINASITIFDDDVVTVSYTTSSASVRYDESDGTVTLCLMGDIPSSQPYTLVLRTDSLGPNPATSGIDYIVNISDLTVTFPAGPPVPACVNITIIDDSISENDESLLLILTNNVSGVNAGPVSRLQITIIDDDILVIISNTTSLYVGDTVLLSCVGLSQPQPDVEITWSKNGADIMNSSSTIIYEEEIAEGGRTFKVSTLVLCGLQGSGAGAYICTVRNNQTTMTATTQLSVPVVSFDSNTSSILLLEGSDASLGVVLSEPANREIMVDVVTIPGTADATDYQALNTTITFSPGQTSISVTVNSTHDIIREEDSEYFSVMLQNPAGGAILGTTINASIVTILDDDVVTVSYTTSSASVRYDESDGTVTLCLIGDIPSSQPYTLVLRTDSLGPNPATSGIDYIVNISDLTVTFPAGPPVPACMNVTIIDDSISENNERFLLLILPNNVSGVSVGPVSRLQITIIDDDILAIISNDTTLSVGDTGLFPCVGFGQSLPDVQITWSKNGADIMNSSSATIYEEEINEGGRIFKVSTLVLCSLQGSDAGSYICTVRDNQTAMTATTQLSLSGLCNSYCDNGGTCFEFSATNVSCSCPREFTGDRCEIALCLSDSCSGVGTCTPRNDSSPLCSCFPGYTGPTCATDLDFCALDTCFNGGICEEGNGITVTCRCVPGYSGTRCGTDLDFCMPSTCENGGTCEEGPGVSTRCDCMPGFTGSSCSIRLPLCQAEQESSWMLNYPETEPGETIDHNCSVIYNDASGVIGVITRLCLETGQWGKVNTSSCQRKDIQEIESRAASVFNQSTVSAIEVEMVLEDLTVATSTQRQTAGTAASLFPQDLQATNNVVNMSLRVLIDDLESTTGSLIPFNTQLVEVIDNILNSSNTPGWQSFPDNQAGSEHLLANAEGYGQYFVYSLMSEDVNISETIAETMSIDRQNIAIQVEQVDLSNISAVLFPSGIDPNQRSNFGNAQSILPKQFLVERGAEVFNVSVVNIIFNNIELFLPSDGLNMTTRPGSSVISTQVVLPLGIDTSISMELIEKSLKNTTAVFRFTTSEFGKEKIVSNPTCSFFDLREALSESSWSSENVETEVAAYHEEDKKFDVVCRSSHLTSFAVLLDVNNVITGLEEEILTYITYIGCTISIIFLIISIAFFIVIIGKELFTSVNYFVHLNLCIALLLGYVIFLAGIETAVRNRIACAFVAALLHYIFTAVFCWMLCEGIMLYLMLVVVFSSLSKKWWLFLILGWGIPVIIVAISLSIIHEQYGTMDYCWISVENPQMGAIWAFAVPMLVIILINVFFLLATLRSLYKAHKRRLTDLAEKGSNRKLVGKLIVASIVLLPLLGLTWIFGLLSIDPSSTVHVSAWVFTVFNSLQGLFIFIFHVLRSEKIHGKLCKKKQKRQSTTATKSAKINFSSRESKFKDGTLTHETGKSSGMDTSFVMENTLTESAQDHKGMAEVDYATFSADEESEQMGLINNGEEDTTFSTSEVKSATYKVSEEMSLANSGKEDTTFSTSEVKSATFSADEVSEEMNLVDSGKEDVTFSTSEVKSATYGADEVSEEMSLANSGKEVMTFSTSKIKSTTFGAEKETEQMNYDKEDKTFPKVFTFTVKWQKPM